MQLIVGRISRPHGIRGEVIVEVRTDAPDERFAVGTVFSTDPTAPRRPGPSDVPLALPATLTIEQARPHQGRYIVLFEGVYDRDGADALRGILLMVDSSQVASAEDPDEYNDFELIGLEAVGRDGERIGEVIRIDHAPASDLLVVRRADGRTALVPFVKAIVIEVDVPAGRIIVEPPDGLFDL